MDHYFTNNQNLKSEIKSLSYSYNEYEFVFMSDNGVFSKEHIDYGSKLLLETFLENYKLNGEIPEVLDVGCGYGYMGIVIAKVLNAKVQMIDVNKRALHLAKRNADSQKIDVKIYESDAYQSVQDKFDVIITNPPVRAGKNVLLEILEGAKNFLKEKGELWYVLRKDQGAKSMEKILSKHYKIENLEKSKGFYVFRCKNY